MISHSAPIPAIHHCFGIILQQREDWWLVEFPDRYRECDPTRALRLSGAIGQTLADTSRRKLGDATFRVSIAMLNPDSDCWCGDFILTRSPDSADRFDIEANPWCAEAAERGIRLARTMIDATLFPIPSGFISVFGSLPDENVPVLAIRASSYTCATFDVLTALYMPSYRPRSPWRDISYDAVTDSGSDILGWTPATDWIKPVAR